MTAPTMVTTPKTVTIIGDSTAKLQALPDSPVPCGFPTSVPCDYSTDGSKAYPALLAQLSGDTVVNLAQSGSITVGDRVVNGVTIPGVLTEVPNIPPNTSVVIWNSGTNDTSINATSPEQLARIDTVATALRAQVPMAKLIIIGVRYYIGRQNNATVDAWDTHEQAVPGAIFIDTRPLWPPDASPAWPDGTHPGAPAVQTLANDLLPLVN